MALLNLKAFMKQCEKRLVYYDHLDYHLFTNGVIMYGIAKGTERPDMYLNELLDKVTKKESEKNSNVFEAVVNAYNQAQREFVVDYEKQVQTSMRSTCRPTRVSASATCWVVTAAGSATISRSHDMGTLIGRLLAVNGGTGYRLRRSRVGRRRCYGT